jgi:hypothetical protein
MKRPRALNHPNEVKKNMQNELRMSEKMISRPVLAGTVYHRCYQSVYVQCPQFSKPPISLNTAVYYFSVLDDEVATVIVPTHGVVDAVD